MLRPQANRATREVYPTGSIFKAITTAGAMHYLNYTGETPIDCPASVTIGDQTWSDWVVENDLEAQGPLTLHSGLVRSCNTVFYQIGADLDDLDPNALPDMARAFGLVPDRHSLLPRAGRHHSRPGMEAGSDQRRLVHR